MQLVWIRKPVVIEECTKLNELFIQKIIYFYQKCIGNLVFIIVQINYELDGQVKAQ